MSNKSKSLTKKRLPTVKQQRFARELFEGKSGTQAVKDAGYKPGNDHNAGTMATRLRQHPAVKSELNELMRQRYPNAPGLILDTLVNVLISDKATNNERIRAAEALAKLTALEPAKKSAHVDVKAKTSVDPFKLPEE